MSSFKLLICLPVESTAEMVTAFFMSTVPEEEFGIAVFDWVFTVAALEEVPKALAGTCTLNKLPMSVLVRYPPEVGVTVSCFSAFTVNPEIADRVMVWLEGLLLFTITETGP